MEAVVWLRMSFKYKVGLKLELERMDKARKAKLGPEPEASGDGKLGSWISAWKGVMFGFQLN